MSKAELLKFADRALDDATDRLAIAGAMRRFIEADEIDLAERARRLLEVNLRRRVAR